MELKLRQPFDPKRWNLAVYNKQFICNAARLQQYDPNSYTRKKILDIYMGCALKHMGSGLLSLFNQLRADYLKSYTEMINEIVDHTEKSIANSQS